MTKEMYVVEVIIDEDGERYVEVWPFHVEDVEETKADFHRSVEAGDYGPGRACGYLEFYDPDTEEMVAKVEVDASYEDDDYDYDDNESYEFFPCNLA